MIAFGQIEMPNVVDPLMGFWEGAFIKNNSFQKLDIQFYKNENQIQSLQIIEDWHPQFGEFVLPVEIDSIGQITFLIFDLCLAIPHYCNNSMVLAQKTIQTKKE